MEIEEHEETTVEEIDRDFGHIKGVLEEMGLR